MTARAVELAAEQFLSAVRNMEKAKSLAAETNANKRKADQDLAWYRGRARETREQLHDAIIEAIQEKELP